MTASASARSAGGCRRQGYLTRGGKRAWDRTTVWGILKNPAYAGAAAFGKTRVGPLPVRLRPVRGGSEQPRRAYGVYDVPPAEWLRVPVPALVDGGLFEAVREQLEENRRRNRQGARGQRYLLQGLLVCRRCGYAYYGKAISLRAAKGKPRAYAYYRCCGSDAHRFGGQRVCSNAQVRTDRLDAAVWHEVERLLRDPARIATEYERRLDEARRRGSDGPELDVVEAQIAKLRRAMARLIDGYADGLIDKAEFEPRITGLRQRIKGWEEQAASLRDEAALRGTLSLIIGRLEDFAQRVRGRMAEVDWSLQRDLIRTLVKRVEIDHDGINVVFRVAPSPSDPGPPDPDSKRTWQGCGWSGRRRPCGVPATVSTTRPSSSTPACSHFRSRRMILRSPIRCSTNRTSQSWLIVSKNDRMSASRIQLIRFLAIPAASASSASCWPRPGRNP